jgi:ribosomal protein S7
MLKRKINIINYKYIDNILYLWYKYHSHFFRSLIFEGRKLWAFNFFSKIKYNLKKNNDLEPFFIFFICMLKISPVLLLFPFKLTSIAQQVAMPISFKKQITFSIKWILKLLKNNKQKITINEIIKVFLNTIENQGLALKKKEEINIEAERNHYLIKYFK